MISVGIATKGRPQILFRTLSHLASQKLAPNAIVVTYREEGDVGLAPLFFPHIHFIRSAFSGLTRQRNAIIDAVGNRSNAIAFIDDDFYLHPAYLLRISEMFQNYPDVVVATGVVLADGINGPGLDVQTAESLLSACPDRPDTGLRSVFNAYGCNMSIRCSFLQNSGLRFDENLPLYGWYEDVDFSRRAAAYGRIVHVPSALGVHLGIKSGRQTGVRLGYSQIANPFYLARKHSLPWSFAVASMLSRSAKNLVLSFCPEAYVDRAGRLRGNVAGWRDLIRGRISPLRIIEIR